jgi:hypothetical protein
VVKVRRHNDNENHEEEEELQVEAARNGMRGTPITTSMSKNFRMMIRDHSFKCQQAPTLHEQEVSVLGEYIRFIGRANTSR